jgi:NAD(P)-dependent dehydrogenase (short-subunit alcohol dehydrogenase family)
MDPAELPSLEGRRVVITGSTSGIGRAAAVELARAGAHVVMGVRDMRRGEEVAAEMAGRGEVRHLDSPTSLPCARSRTHGRASEAVTTAGSTS